MKEKILLAVLFGGMSSEHEVSCLSAASVIEHLDKNQYEIFAVGITKEGNWFLTDSPVACISDGSWIENRRNRKTLISPNTEDKGLLIFEQDGSCQLQKLDVVFPVLHGKNGEDGTMQGLLELSGIPYVGSGTTSSAACMDKGITKLMVKGTDVKQADFYLTDRYSFASNPQEILREIELHFGGYPLFVKPANAGSSVGISKAGNGLQLFEAIRIAAEEDHKILIEETIVGREIEVAVLGDRHPRASLVGEIIAANEFYDYEAKYLNAASRTEIVSDLSEQKIEEIQENALTVYHTMGCKGLARVDFFLTGAGDVIFNEINTMPGFTSISMYSKLWEATDLPYSELLDMLIELAMGERE